MNARLILFSIGLTGVLSFTSCRERKTDDPLQAYKYWAGSLPEKNVSLIHGNYWQSAHFTKEYILYLELKAPSSWGRAFISQNHFAETTKSLDIPSDAPKWFIPGKNFRVFVPREVNEGTMLFEDTLTGKIFYYEIQL